MVAEVYQQADLETRGPQIVVNLGLVLACRLANFAIHLSPEPKIKSTGPRNTRNTRKKT